MLGEEINGRKKGRSFFVRVISAHAVSKVSFLLEFYGIELYQPGHIFVTVVQKCEQNSLNVSTFSILTYSAMPKEQ